MKSELQIHRYIAKLVIISHHKADLMNRQKIMTLNESVLLVEADLLGNVALYTPWQFRSCTLVG